MEILIIILIIATPIIIIGILINKMIDKVFDKKPIPEPQEPQQPLPKVKPEQVDVLIAIDQKLVTQNRHLAAIRSYIGWLLAIMIIPIIASIISTIVLLLASVGFINIFN